jgi:fumarate reductase flavoprotein subunit
MKKLLTALIILAFTAGFCAFAQQFTPLEVREHSTGEKAKYLAGSHVEKGNAECITCHDGQVKVDDSEISVNNGCINCHGDLPSVAETVVPKGEINPHESHLGTINCTSCHSGHTASFVYCNNCHSFAELNIAFGGKKPKYTTFNVKDYLKVKPLFTEKVDVVIIGSGGAGYAAAITAKEAGASVLVIEKMPIPGGNSQLSAGGTNAAWTKFQKQANITDSPENMFYDTMKGGGFKSDPKLVNVLAFKSNDTIEWLSSHGINLSQVNAGGGASQPRFHAPSGGIAVGSYLINNLKRIAEEKDIEVRVNSKAVRLLIDKNRAVTGVIVEGKHSGLYLVQAKSIVLAAGGFSANAALVESLRPAFKGMTTSNQPGALGEGMALAADVGADLIGMEEIQIHPSVAVGSQILVTEAVRGVGAILVNHEGNRFVDELTTRDKASAAILAQRGQTAYLIIDDDTVERLAQINGYFHLGLVKSGANIAELAKAINVPADNLTKTIERYNSFVAKKSDDDFGRKIMVQSFGHGKYHAIEVAPGIHYTMGGAYINTDAQILDKAGKPIKNLYGAGEVTGGVHGTNRLGGNSTSEMITFGRIAGDSAFKNTAATK